MRLQFICKFGFTNFCGLFKLIYIFSNKEIKVYNANTCNLNGLTSEKFQRFGYEIALKYPFSKVFLIISIKEMTRNFFYFI